MLGVSPHNLKQLYCSFVSAGSNSESVSAELEKAAHQDWESHKVTIPKRVQKCKDVALGDEHLSLCGD